MASDIVENPEFDGDDHGGDQPNVDKASEEFNKLTPSQQHKMLLQREADEHLFLRYLELDPVVEPSDAPSSQKKPPTNKVGRTPFTTTRRLQRDSSGGFGFTVVWTQPPRVERVLGGAPAERGGVRPGDFLVFVGNRNVVTAPEDEVRHLVKNSGSQLIIETFRRTQQNGLLSNSTNQTIPPSALSKQRGSTASHVTISDLAGSSVHALGRVGNLGSAITGLGSGLIQPLNSDSRVDFTCSHQALQSSGTFRPGTACSGATTTQSLDINVNNQSAGQTMSSSRRKLQLPQVTFSKEPSELTAEERLRAALSSVVCRERRYAAALRHGLARFAAPLADRADLIAPSDHRILFQNLDEILQLSEDILDQVSHEDCDLQTSNVIAVYLQKTPSFLSIYKRYCLGLKRADCVLVRKSRDTTGAFVKFCTSPPMPRRRPDITSLVHKPLEQFRELLRLLRTASAVAAGPQANPQLMLEKKQLQVIVDQLQAGYQEVTAGSGLMGLAGEGKPLLSVADLESRLVFTRCKPFVLSTPGRQWIFGGDLSRVEGRSTRPYWALLFSDLLLFAKVSRDRVLFITEEPVLLSTVKETCFNVRKKATEFRLVLGRPGGESPTVHCTPRLPMRARLVSLRAPSPDLKAVWQSLLQRQIYRVHTTSGTPLGSPLDSPDPQTSFSLATLELDSQQRQVPADTHTSLASLSRLHIMSSYRSHLNILSEDEGINEDSYKIQEPERPRVSFDVKPNGQVRTCRKLAFGRGPLCSTWVNNQGSARTLNSYEFGNYNSSDRMNNKSINETAFDGIEYMQVSANNNKINENHTNGNEKTPETPSANISSSESFRSSKNSQTFSSRFVSTNSIDRAKSETNSKITPSSPSAILTLSSLDAIGSQCEVRSSGGENGIGIEHSCHWESFEADLAIADLDLDPSFKTDVEEDTYFHDEFLFDNMFLPDKPTPPNTLDL